MYLSVVIPAYNEKANLPQVIDAVLQTISTIPVIEQYEIIIVDDHSEDGTADIVKKYNKKHIYSLRLSRRSGSHTAIRAGFRAAQGNAALFISADGQEDPGILKQMAEKLLAGNDIVWGLRKKREENFIDSIFTSLFYSSLKKLSGIKTELDISKADFYLINRKALDAINSCKEHNTSLFGLLLWIGFRQDHVIYDRRQRLSGASKWSFRSRSKMAKDWLIAFSDLPFRLMMYIGTLSFLAGIVLLITSFICPVECCYNNMHLAIILSILGLIMCISGLLGEYLNRVLDESRTRPLFFIEKDSRQNEN